MGTFLLCLSLSSIVNVTQITHLSQGTLLNESSSLRENISKSEGNIRNKTKKTMSVVLSYAAFGIKR